MNACDAGHLTPSTNTKQTKKNCLLIINDGDLMMIRKKQTKNIFLFDFDFILIYFFLNK